MGTTVQAILEQHFDAFAARHPLAGYQRDAAWRMRHCRTPALERKRCQEPLFGY
jgi:hypothetical protein